MESMKLFKQIDIEWLFDYVYNNYDESVFCGFIESMLSLFEKGNVMYNENPFLEANKDINQYFESIKCLLFSDETMEIVSDLVEDNTTKNHFNSLYEDLEQ